MMATKRFVSTTGYGLTVFASDPRGNSQEIRVGAEDDPFETDDKHLIQALSGTPMVVELKGDRAKAAAQDKQIDVEKTEQADPAPEPEPEPAPTPKPDPEPEPDPVPEAPAKSASTADRKSKSKTKGGR